MARRVVGSRHGLGIIAIAAFVGLIAIIDGRQIIAAEPSSKAPDRDALRSRTSDLLAGGKWTSDPGGQVKVLRSADGEVILRWEFQVDKSAFGVIGLRAEDLGLPLPQRIPLDVKTNIPYLIVLLGDRDGTCGFYQHFGLRGKPWSKVEIDPAKPRFLWSPGGDGKLSDLDRILFGIEPRAGEVKGNGRYVIEIRVAQAAEEEAAAGAKPATPDCDPLMADYQKVRKAAADAVSSLGDAIKEAQVAALGVDCEQVTYYVGHDALNWSQRDADYGLENTKPRILEEAVRQVEWVQQACARAEKELAARVAQGDRRTLKRPAMGDLRVVRGDYYDRERPVLITGLVSPWTRALRPYGLNGISQFEFRTAAAALGIVDSAAEAGVAIDLLAELHAVPGEFYEKHADLDPGRFRRSRNPFMPVNMDSPGLKEWRAASHDDIVTALKGRGNVASYDLCNELWYAEGPYYDPDDFRAFLRGRHDDDVARLNRVWATDFASFKEVEYVPWRRAARVDMGRYTAYRVARWVGWDSDYVRSIHPELVTYVKILGHFWSTLGAGVDGLSAATVGNGADCYPSVGKWHGAMGNDTKTDSRFAADFWTQSIIIDTFRSLTPEKPFIDSEYHLISLGDSQVPGEFVRAMMWQGALHGRDAAYVWAGQRRGLHPWVSYGSSDHLFMTQPWAVEALGHASLDLERLAEYVLAFQHREAEVAMLRCGVEFPEWYRMLYFQDCPFDLVTPDSVEHGRLKGYRVLVCPDGSYLSAAGMKQVASFLQRGGVLVMGETALALDEYGQGNDMSALAGVGGTIVQAQGAELAAKLNQAIEKARIARPVRSNGKYVELGSRIVNGRRVVYAINFSAETQDLAIQTAAAPLRGTDLISGRRVDGPVTLKPLDVLLVEADGHAQDGGKDR